MSVDKNDYLTVAQQAVQSASGIAMKYFRSPHLKIYNKGTGLSGSKKYDWVTTADLEAEQAIISIIEQYYPDHSIVPEESENINRSSEYQWYIDPISSTDNYVRGLPHFACVVGLAYQGKPFLGVVADPYYGKMFWAQVGRGSFFMNEPIQVSDISDIEQAVVSTRMKKAITQSGKDHDYWAQVFLKSRMKVKAIRIIGSNALHMCYVAMGRFDVFFNYQLDIRSHVGAIVIAREAGAKITRFDNSPWHIGAPDIVVSNGLLHDEILEFLKD